MSDLDAVIELLERWRDATGVGRLRIGIDATRVIAQLPPERKRELAIEVADRVAPQLVPAIQAESGDLSGEQVGALVDLLRRADRHQLDDLVTALRTGDIGGAAGIVGDAADIVAGPDEETDALLEDIATPDEPPETGVGQPGGGLASDAVVESDGVAEQDAIAEPDEAPEPAEGTSSAVGAGAGAVSGGVAAAAAAATAADRDEVAVAPDGSLELDEEAVRDRLEEEAAERAEQYRDSSSDVPEVPAYRAPEVDFIKDSADWEFPDTSVETVAPLHERMSRSRGDVAGRRLAAPPVSATVASLTATQDGYRRRRAAMEAIRAGRLESDDVPAVVRSFERGTDRVWIAGAALDAGLIHVSDLDELQLPDSAVRRLERRAR